MPNNLGIIAYGTQKDREKLAVLSSLSKQSGSEFIITMIRRQYKEVFGELEPSQIPNKGPIYRS